MATNLTDVSAFTSPVVAPADGDTRNAASITQGEQPLADRTRFLLNASVGQLLWNGRLRVDAVTTGIGVYVGAIESLLIGTSLLSQAAETEIAGALPLAGLSSWYYVYAYDNAGTLALQASLDAPDAALVWKSTGDLTHRYLGCFRTDGSGNPIDVIRSERLFAHRLIDSTRRHLVLSGIRNIELDAVEQVYALCYYALCIAAALATTRMSPL